MKFILNCNTCGAKMNVNLPNPPMCCPCCGSRDIRIEYSKGRISAMETLQELREMRPEVLRQMELLIQLRAEYEDKMQKIRVYKHRDLVFPEEMNGLDLPPTNIAKALKEYRHNKE